jgi:hypothetical protein
MYRKLSGETAFFLCPPTNELKLRRNRKERMLLLKRSFEHPNSQIFPNDNKDEAANEFEEGDDNPRLKFHEDSDIYLQRIGNPTS